MRNKEATQLYHQADELFRAKKYPEALVILDQLDEQFPNWKNVLYPRALCLANLDRFEEAKQICEYLVNVYKDPRAQKLLTKVSKTVQKDEPVGGTSLEDLNKDSFLDQPAGEDGAGATALMSSDLMAMDPNEIANLDIPDLDDSVIKAPAPSPEAQKAAAKGEGGGKWPLIIAAVFAVVVLGGLIVLALLRGPSEEREQVAQRTPPQQQAPAGPPPAPSSDDRFGPSEETLPPPADRFGPGGAPRTPAFRGEAGEEGAPAEGAEDAYGYGADYSYGDSYGAQEFGLLSIFNVFSMGANIVAMLVVVVLSLPSTILSIYLTLLLTNNLPQGLFWPDILNCSIVALPITFLSTIFSCIGYAVGLYTLYKAYDLGIAELMVFVLIHIGVSLVYFGLLFVIFVMVIGMSFGALGIGGETYTYQLLAFLF
jgi:tetratricopeptide repeat protein